MIPQLKTLRIAFFGTKSFAAYHLYKLIFCSAHKIVAVFTQEIQISNQKTLLSCYKISQACNLSLFQSRNLSMSKIADTVKKLAVDIIVVVSYGLILPQKILNIPKFGCINVHGSLLPRWRGPAPIQRALEHGDRTTGISIIKMNPGVDTGNILYKIPCAILPTDTTYTLSKKLAYIGANSLLLIIDKIILGTNKSIPQNPLHATYAHKLNKQETRINWNYSAKKIEQQIRAFNPWPGSYFQIKTTRIKVWNATVKIDDNYYYQNIIQNHKSTVIPGLILQSNTSGIYVVTGSGILILTVLQISGKKKSSVKDILNAYHRWFIPNSILE